MYTSDMVWQHSAKLFLRFGQSDRIEHGVRESCLDLWEPVPANIGAILWQFHRAAAGLAYMYAIHVQESATTGNCNSLAPHGPVTVINYLYTINKTGVRAPAQAIPFHGEMGKFSPCHRSASQCTSGWPVDLSYLAKYNGKCRKLLLHVGFEPTTI